MKRFLKKRWHSIPVAMVSVLLVLTLIAGGAFAAEAFITTEQSITQMVEEDYGTITAPAIELPNVKVGKSFTETYSNAVTVELGPSGVGKEFRMSATASDLYTSFDVTITLISKPEGSEVGLYGYGISGGGIIGIQLDVEGTYIFDQTIEVTAGSTSGTAESTVTFTLEEYTGPPPHE